MKKFKSLKKGSTVYMLKQAYWGGFGYSCPTISGVKSINKDVMSIELTNGHSFNVMADNSKMDFGHVKLFTNDRDADRTFLKLEYNA